MQHVQLFHPKPRNTENKECISQMFLSRVGVPAQRKKETKPLRYKHLSQNSSTAQIFLKWIVAVWMKYAHDLSNALQKAGLLHLQTKYGKQLFDASTFVSQSCFHSALGAQNRY